MAGELMAGFIGEDAKHAGQPATLARGILRMQIEVSVAQDTGDCIERNTGVEK